jgi:hypothetical protein
MPFVFKNIDPPGPNPPFRPVSVYPPHLCWGRGGGEDTLAGWRGGWGVNILKAQDTALYSTYIESSLVLRIRIRHPLLF